MSFQYEAGARRIMARLQKTDLEGSRILDRKTRRGIQVECRSSRLGRIPLARGKNWESVYRQLRSLQPNTRG